MKSFKIKKQIGKKVKVKVKKKKYKKCVIRIFLCVLFKQLQLICAFFVKELYN